MPVNCGLLALLAAVSAQTSYRIGVEGHEIASVERIVTRKAFRTLLEDTKFSSVDAVDADYSFYGLLSETPPMMPNPSPPLESPPSFPPPAPAPPSPPPAMPCTTLLLS
ncbi:hypothetical protein CYMTET_25719 [Cymbomonas tetramitiformis]|uniref:Uncharacterized protein n=1 Tax=Cymbomonas tetramitiformis TaxID=36881 RepID=A0AAE0FT64_9CHLO|nr:hypothetical protein CYMTET_25719 [Cymbomonas tetramitiformis]